MSTLEKLMELNKVSEEKMKPQKENKVVSNEERINDLEIAVCELLEAFAESE